MDGIGKGMPDPEDSPEGVGPETQVGNLP